MKKTIDFYFEFYSPYGYLASLKIDELAERHSRKAIWKPFMLGPTFAITGHQPLMDTPLMGEYSYQDLYRSARLQGVTIQMPKEFPKSSLNCARAFYALVDDQPEQAKALARAIYHATFELGQDGTQPELIGSLATDIGIDSEWLLTRIQQPEVKERLKTETLGAIDRGVFGSPFIFIEDEPFWGNDRLDQVDRWLQTGGW